MNSAEFRLAMAALPEPPTNSRPPFWEFWRHQLWQLGQSDDVANFWKWPPVYHTMTVNHFPIGRELLYLQEDWPRWESVVADPDNETNQRNLIMQASHLRRWELTTNTRVEELESIVEFGGGYGAMAYICRRLGFTGRYNIIDLPEFKVLQKYWLSTQGVKFVHVTEPKDSDLFIGCYSISEIPPEDRGQWMGRAESYLLLCSGQFAYWKNTIWMLAIMDSMPELRWNLIPYEGRPDSYLIGWPA